MKRAGWVGVAAMGLLLTGCGSGVSKDATYETALALREAAVEVGYECPQWSDDDPVPDFDAGSCLTDHRDQFRVYTDPVAREADTEDAILGTQLAMVGNRTNMALLVGPNWTIAGPVDRIDMLEGALGGYQPDISDLRLGI